MLLIRYLWFVLFSFLFFFYTLTIIGVDAKPSTGKLFLCIQFLLLYSLSFFFPVAPLRLWYPPLTHEERKKLDAIFFIVYGLADSSLFFIFIFFVAMPIPN